MEYQVGGKNAGNIKKFVLLSCCFTYVKIADAIGSNRR